MLVYEVTPGIYKIFSKIASLKTYRHGYFSKQQNETGYFCGMTLYTLWESVYLKCGRYLSFISPQDQISGAGSDSTRLTIIFIFILFSPVSTVSIHSSFPIEQQSYWLKINKNIRNRFRTAALYIILQIFSTIDILFCCFIYFA